MKPVRCAICQKAIGVYEPAIAVGDGVLYVTSLARGARAHAGQPFVHLGCAPRSTAPGGEYP